MNTTLKFVVQLQIKTRESYKKLGYNTNILHNREIEKDLLGNTECYSYMYEKLQ